MDALEDLPASMLCLEDPHIKAEEEEEEEDRASHVSSGRGSDDEEPDPSTSAPATKRRKKNPLDLSEVPMNLPPIPSDKPGSASRFKGVSKHRKKWKAMIHNAEFEAEPQRLLITQHMHFVDPIVLGRRKAAIVTMYGQTPALPTAISSLLRVRASGGGL